MSSIDTAVLEFSQYQKSDDAPFAIYAEPECLIEKNDGSKCSLVSLFTTKVSKHIPSGFSMSAMSSFGSY